jgi:hypothetical protein
MKMCSMGQSLAQNILLKASYNYRIEHQTTRYVVGYTAALYFLLFCTSNLNSSLDPVGTRG